MRFSFFQLWIIGAIATLAMGCGSQVCDKSVSQVTIDSESR